jgi:hypothetical protein
MKRNVTKLALGKETVRDFTLPKNAVLGMAPPPPPPPTEYC